MAGNCAERQSRGAAVVTLSIKWLFTVLIGAVFAGPVSAADTAGARTFLESLYASYSDAATPPPVLGEKAPVIFSANLLKLIRADQASAHGEVGLLDYDPLCGCQDYQQLKVTSIRLRELSAERLRATVHIVNSDQPRTMTFILVRENEQWRIADVRDTSTPSLVEFLRRGLPAR